MHQNVEVLVEIGRNWPPLAYLLTVNIYNTEGRRVIGCINMTERKRYNKIVILSRCAGVVVSDTSPSCCNKDEKFNRIKAI